MSANPPRFRNRSENEFAGCRAALDSLHQQDPGTLSIGLILHRHRLLFSFVGGGGGRFKLDDNLVTNRHDDGTTTTRFAPVSAAETEYYVTELVDRTNDALAAGVVHPVLITAAFGLDLLCIHPFADGNGRVARLMTTYLMSRSGYGVGRYVSLEQVIYETKDDYYAALGASTTGWFDDGAHDVWPWASSFLGCVADAYERFADRIASGTNGGTKQDRIRDFVRLHSLATLSISDDQRLVQRRRSRRPHRFARWLLWATPIGRIGPATTERVALTAPVPTSPPRVVCAVRASETAESSPAPQHGRSPPRRVGRDHRCADEDGTCSNGVPSLRQLRRCRRSAKRPTP